MKLIIGRGLFSFLLGIIALLLVFFTNISINTLETALSRSAVAFVTFLIIGYIAHLLLSLSETTNNEKNKVDILSEAKDMDLNEIYQTSKEEDFKPLEFEQITNKKDN